MQESKGAEYTCWSRAGLVATVRLAYNQMNVRSMKTVVADLEGDHTQQRRPPTPLNGRRWLTSKPTRPQTAHVRLTSSTVKGDPFSFPPKIFLRSSEFNLILPTRRHAASGLGFCTALLINTMSWTYVDRSI